MNTEIIPPQVPEKAYEFFTVEEIALLWKEYVYECMSGEFGNRTHGISRTYNEGCHGPRCSRAMLEDNAKRRGGKNSPRSIMKFALLDIFRVELEARQQYLLANLFGPPPPKEVHRELESS